MKPFRIIAVALVAALSSCAPTKYLSKADFEAIDDVAITTPFAYITYIENKVGEQYNDSLSYACACLAADAVKASTLPTGDFVDIEFGEDDVYQSAIASLRDIKAKKAGEAPVPGVLLELLRNSGHRYGVFTFTNGFVMDNKSYAKTVAASFAVSLLTLILTMGTATAYSYAVKERFTIWTAVVDAETERIVFYNTGIYDGGDPTREKDVRRVVDRLFKDFK